MSTTTLTPESRLQFAFAPDQCYWWTHDDGQLMVAMSAARFSPLGDYTRDSFELSMVLDAPPPEEDSRYTTKRDTLRGIWHRSAFHLRLRSRRGHVALRRVDDNTLRGTFKAVCFSEKFQVLTGWVRQTQILLQGQLTAVHNAAAGRVILQRTKEYTGRPTESEVPAIKPVN